MVKDKQVIFDEHIIDAALDEVMHSAFMTYAEYVTMERALPRVEDGLKPVQRRILYTLNELGITPDKPYKKSARVVGETLGKYHPHGDTSVYDAMVRLSQDFVMRMPLIDGHGNFGSMDGDSPAAMRYTEVRMSPLAMEMLRDINKDTVPFRPNFDDTEQEPDMLPARYPNLLVNGASGIAVGLATNIPPHNLDEVISAVLLRIDKPECTLNNIMKHIKGPDFPTGGYVVAGDGLRQAYETGRGKVQLRAKTHIEKLISGKSAIVITEMPYEVKKAALLEKILAVSESKKELFGGIDDIRDESDREGIRAVVEIKRGHDAQKILQLLYKYTDLQITFGINIMAIADGAPRQLSLLEVIDHYITHQKNVVTRRTRYDLEKAEKREHILAGLIIAVKNIDNVIAIIRGAKNLETAKKGLMNTFNITGVQAQAILDMRLARLNRLEVSALEKEYKEVTELINYYRSVLESEKKLMGVIKSELSAIRKKFSDGRRTEIISESEAVLDVDESEFAVKEECMVALTIGGLIKRLPLKVAQKGFDVAETEPKNLPKAVLNADASEKLYVFTSAGNMYLIPVSSLPEGKLKDGGKQLNALINGVDTGEEILLISTISALKDKKLYFATKNGFVKCVNGGEFDVKKARIISTMLKDDDKLIYVGADDQSAADMLFITVDGMALRVLKDEIPVMGRTAKGVASIKTSPNAGVVFAGQPESRGEDIILMTDLGFAKKTHADAVAVKGRNTKGQRVFKLDKHVGAAVAGAVLAAGNDIVTATQSGLDPQTVDFEQFQTNTKSAAPMQVVPVGATNKVVKVDVSRA